MSRIVQGRARRRSHLLKRRAHAGRTNGGKSPAGLIATAVDADNYELGANSNAVPSTGTFVFSNVNLYANVGVRCAQGAANCDNTGAASQNTLWTPNNVTALAPLPPSGITGDVSFAALLAELSLAESSIPTLAATQTLATNAGKISTDTTINVVSGLNVININTGGNDFLLENADLIINGPADAYVIFRLNDVNQAGTEQFKNFKISNGGIFIGTGGIGLENILFFLDDGRDFDFSNTILNGAASWTFGTEANITINNGQGCTQLIGDKIDLNNVRFSGCSFSPTEPVPEPATLLLLGSAAVALAGYRRLRR